jgi:hypothetical protein
VSYTRSDGPSIGARQKLSRQDDLMASASAPPAEGARSSRPFNAARVLASPVTLVTACALAGLLRLAVYAADRSLVIDEAFVALNVARRSPTGLTGELDWNSAAPVVFLEIEKALTALFGNSEHVLRAAPFVASLVAIPLFVMLARRILEPRVVPLAALLFAGTALATQYAAIVKPYAFDIMFVIGLSLATVAVLRGVGGRWVVLLLATLGIVSPLFSYASAFAVAASATVLVLDAVVQDSRARRMRAFAVVCGWLLVLAIMFLVHRSTLSHLRHSLTRENINSLTSIRNAGGAVRQVLGVSPYSNDLGVAFAFAAAAAAAILFLVGVVRLARIAWDTALVLLLPAVFLLIASALGWYPVLPRTMLFLAPMLVIFIAAGCSALLESDRAILVRGSVLALLGLVLVAEAASTARAVQGVRPDDGIEPIINTLAQRERRGDTVYLSFAAQYPFAHYLECDCAGANVARAKRERLWPVEAAPGGVEQWAPALRSHSNRFRIGTFRDYGLEHTLRDLAQLPRGRVWVILAGPNAEERRTLVERLDSRGTRIWTYNNSGGVLTVSGYLYLLRGTAAASDASSRARLAGQE